jgi:D-alanine-D-alanine ligase
MRIGIAYDLKVEDDPACPSPAGAPDDLHEEFDSPATIDAIADVFRGLGHDVQKLGDGRELLEQLLADPPEFVFNFAEGEGVGRCREARVPAVLEMLGIPYSGSDPLTMAVTLDKECAKRLVQAVGVRVPWGLTVPAEPLPLPDLTPVTEHLPVIVKPAWEGSSKGIRGQSVVERPEELRRVLSSMRRIYQQPVLVEEYVDGVEVTVGILGNERPRLLGMMSIMPREATDRFVYSLEVKRDFLRQVRYESPPTLPSTTREGLAVAALAAYEALGCRDVARIDFRVRDDVPHFLEVNPLPGLNPQTSDLVILARLVGWTHSQLVEAILNAALDRCGCTGRSSLVVH